MSLRMKELRIRKDEISRQQDAACSKGSQLCMVNFAAVYNQNFDEVALKMDAFYQWIN